MYCDGSDQEKRGMTTRSNLPDDCGTIARRAFLEVTHAGPNELRYYRKIAEPMPLTEFDQALAKFDQCRL